MRTLRIFGSVLLSLFVVSASADSLPEEWLQEGRELAERAAADNIAYDVVTSLTTEVGPRLAGTEAEARARDWAVELLESLEFDRVYVEGFQVPLWERHIEHGKIVTPSEQPIVLVGLGGSASTPEEGARGAVLRVESPEELMSMADGSADGMIIFVDQPMVRTKDGEGYGAAVKKRRVTGEHAHRVGAVGALIRSVGTSGHRFAHTGQMARAGTSSAPVAPTAAVSGPDADQLTRLLERHDVVEVEMTLTSELRPSAPSGNVIAEWRGKTKPDEVVIIGAHLDSWDLGTGAVDDGAGVGIVLGAAMALREAFPEGFDRTLRVILFGSEEVGLVGAKAYAEAHKDELDNIVLAFESDFGAGDIWRLDHGVTEAGLPAVADLTRMIAHLNVIPGKSGATGGPDISPMAAMGVPVITPLQDGWDYFDLHHTPNDTLDKIAPNALDQNVAVYSAILSVALRDGVNFK